MQDTPQQLKLDRILAASRASVWRCWTEPDLLVRWFCPTPWTASDADVDLVPGGAFSTVMDGPEGQRFENPGVYLAIESGRRIVFTDAFAPGWRPAGRPFMVAEVTFEDDPSGGTRYGARAMHWTEEARKEHEAMGFADGWRRAADQLEALAASL